MAKHITIIGGGIIGLACAYYLSESGHHVRIIEQKKIGESCAQGNAGYISPSHFIPLAAPGMVKKGLKWMFNSESPFYIRPRLDWQLIKWLWQFNRYCNPQHVEQVKLSLLQMCQKSSELYAELASITNNEFHLKNNGCYVLCETQKGLDHELDIVTQAQQLGLNAREVTKTDLQEKYPDITWTVKGGVYFPEDAHVHPGSLLNSLHNLLKNKSVDFVEQTQVSKINFKHDKVISIETNNESFDVEELLITSGSWTPLLMKTLAIDFPIQAGKGYSVTIDKPWNINTPIILSEAAVAITPFENKIRFGGTMELAGIDLTINNPRVEGILKAVKRTMPGFKVDEVDRSIAWSGLRPLSPDGLPLIGRPSAYRNLVVACGHAMLGLTLAPVTGYLVSKILNNEPINNELSQWQQVISANRFL